jgi:hypothetical protein
MIKRIRDIAEDEQYCTKSLANNVIKINCVTPETYRKMVKDFTNNNILYRTDQLKEERAYRIVIKYLHHSTDTEDIRQELFERGQNVRNTINAQHGTTKEPLNLFFVDLEPAENNKEIYSIKHYQKKHTNRASLSKEEQYHTMYEMPTIWAHKIILQQTIHVR